MPIIVKGQILIPGDEKEKPLKVEKNISQPPKEKIETVSDYHEEKHGDLHKLFNTKSDYLRDILDLDFNK